MKFFPASSFWISRFHKFPIHLYLFMLMGGGLLLSMINLIVPLEIGMDVFFSFCFLALFYLETSPLIYLFFLSILQDILWQLPLGLSAGVVGGEALFVAAFRRLIKKPHFYYHWFAFSLAYLGIMVPLKILFFHFHSGRFLLLESLLTIFFYPFWAFLIGRFLIRLY